MNKERHCKNTVFAHSTGIYKAHKLDYKKGIIGGYLLFPGYGVSNPYREFDIVDCSIKEVK